MKKWVKFWAGLLCTVILASGFAGCKNDRQYVSVELWTYYTGAIAEGFDHLIKTFNDTVGHKSKIVIAPKHLGTVNNLTEKLNASLEDRRGSEPLPDMFMAYADVAYSADKTKELANLGRYFTQSELSAYVEGYIEEGCLGKDALKLFPVAKATEAILLNYGEWQKFASAFNVGKTGAERVELSDFNTYEGIIAQAQKYYDFSGGKALFARDSVDNYMIVGAAALGKPLVDVQENGTASNVFDKAVIRELWDNYYVPHMNGLFSRKGKFGTDSMKSVDVLAALGSTSATAYLPEKTANGEPIELKILKAPTFQGKPKYYTQQGGGLSAFKAEPEIEKACVEFIKWFTAEEQNAEFCVKTGYLPVKKSASNYDSLKKYFSDDTRTAVRELFKTAGEMALSAFSMYTMRPFLKSTEVRDLFKNDFETLCQSDVRTLAALLDPASDSYNPQAYPEKKAEKLSDKNFENWYEKTKDQIQTLVDESNRG